MCSGSTFLVLLQHDEVVQLRVDGAGGQRLDVPQERRQRDREVALLAGRQGLVVQAVLGVAPLPVGLRDLGLELADGPIAGVLGVARQDVDEVDDPLALVGRRVANDEPERRDRPERCPGVRPGDPVERHQLPTVTPVLTP